MQHVDVFHFMSSVSRNKMNHSKFLIILLNFKGDIEQKVCGIDQISCYKEVMRGFNQKLHDCGCLNQCNEVNYEAIIQKEK
jgi:hypothetical protein